MNSYKKIRNYIFKRQKKIFIEEYGWNFKFFPRPYAKIKMMLNLEISTFLLYLLNKTQITPNQITIFGVLWVYLGTSLILINEKIFIYVSLFIFFTKLIPDILDGSLAHLKNSYSKSGYELDLWSGDVNKIGVIAGTLFYTALNTDNNIFFIILILIIFFNFVDPRKHLISFKSSIIYKKNLKTHSNKIIKSKQSLLFKILKFFHYDGGSPYTDFIILLIIIDLNFDIIFILEIISYLWLILYFLSFMRSIFIIKSLK